METENTPIENTIKSEETSLTLKLNDSGNVVYSEKDGGQLEFIQNEQPKMTSNEQSKGKRGANNINEIIDKLINHQETLLKKIDIIERNVKLIQKDMDELKKELKYLSPFEEENINIVKDATEIRKIECGLEFNDVNLREVQTMKKIFSILNSKTTKRSISINSEIENQISALLTKYLDDKKLGHSETINTGLMLALLKSRF